MNTTHIAQKALVENIQQKLERYEQALHDLAHFNFVHHVDVIFKSDADIYSEIIDLMHARAIAALEVE